MGKYKSLEVGTRFGGYTIIGEEFKENGKFFYSCICNCGVIKKVLKYHLIHRNLIGCRKCSNSRRIANSAKKRRLPENTKIGKLTILKYDRENRKYICRCDCGNLYQSSNYNLKKTGNCGCVRKEKMEKKYQSYVGLKINNFKFLKYIGIKKNLPFFLIRCICGKKYEKCVHLNRIPFSCGCLTKKNTKLKKEDIKTIREFYKSKYYTNNELAKMFSVEKTTIGRIVNNITWKNV
jgi:hypothetical protein